MHWMLALQDCPCGSPLLYAVILIYIWEYLSFALKRIYTRRFRMSRWTRNWGDTKREMGDSRGKKTVDYKEGGKDKVTAGTYIHAQCGWVCNSLTGCAMCKLSRIVTYILEICAMVFPHIQLVSPAFSEGGLKLLSCVTVKIGILDAG